MKTLLALAGLLMCGCLVARDDKLAPPVKELIEEEKEGTALKVPGVEPTADRIAQLKLPDGFRIAKFADGLGKPRMFAVGDDGTLYVTRREPGDVLALRDTAGDGKADQKDVVVKNLPGAHGIVLHGGKMYVATVRELYAGEMKDGKVGEMKKLIGDLPEGGRHPNRTLAFDPDGMLYITVGSTCNNCVEPNPEAATILRAKPDGSDRKIFAKGLRNTLGFGWHPKTKEMWGMDHGSDWLGNDTPPEELNRLQEGKHYGWPFVYGDRKLIDYKDGPPEKKLREFADKTEPMTLGYQAHSAPIQMTFYTGDQFPAEYKNDAFVCMRGSWNRKPPAGYEVVRIRFDETGKPQKFEPFLTGFLLKGPEQFARLAGIAQAKDGSLFIGDDTNGVIYRVTYDKKK
jgi:glucose/arabinose dehydrogenase